MSAARPWARWLSPGAVATLCSPVAGLFVEVLAAALFLAGRRRRGLAAWTVVPPIATLAQAAPADGGPLIAELARLDAQLGRVEVVPLRTHGEASMVAPHVGLARGWNRQADVERNPLFYDGTLTAASYRTWLTDWSVGYVVLPAKEPDSSGIAEAGLLTAGQTWLPLVWRDTSWRIYRVEGSDPLVWAPAAVVSAGPAALTDAMPRAGTALVRIVWSPWLAIDGDDDDTTPRACLTRGGEWTELVVPAAGTYTIATRNTIDRSTPCRPADQASAVQIKAPSPATTQ